MKKSFYILGTNLTVSGWGQTQSGTTSNVLKATFMSGMSNENCAAAVGAPSTFFGPYHICANGLVTNSSICFGDSGGTIFTLTAKKICHKYELVNT
jgi:hypothetical protein